MAQAYTRRSMISAGTTALALSVTARRSSAWAESQTNAANFALPVVNDKQDRRLATLHTPMIKLDESMQTNPSGLLVESIGFNPKFSEWEGKNRLGISTYNALIYAHSVAHEYLGTDNDTARLQNMLFGAAVPKEPNWADYLDQIRSDKELTFPIMALPTHSPVAEENLQWMTVDMREYVRFNFTTDPNQMFNYQGFDDENGQNVRMDGYTIRVNSRRGLQLDIYANTSVISDDLLEQSHMERQEWYDLYFNTFLRRALLITEMTLGVVAWDQYSTTPNYYSFTGMYLISNYSDRTEKGAIFADQFRMIVGPYEETAEGSPARLLVSELSS